MATYQAYTEFSTGGGFDNSDSRIGSSDGEVKRTNTLTPVTIKQILESKPLVQDGPFVIHNQELHSICFVGVIRNISDQTQSIFLTIEDGTGQIEVRKWSEDANDLAAGDEDKNGAQDSQLSKQHEIGSYVIVYGALKEFGGKKNVQYAVIKNIKSFNEVIAHHLEVIKSHAIANGKMKGVGASNDQGQQLFVTEGSDAGAPLQRILDFCKEQCTGKDPNSFAVAIQLMTQTLNLDETVVRECCNTLTEQGYIYPTFDDNSFFAL
ncbi:hypothetical protein TPHA_0P01430 [Tetrapisispora phaffii CBS 4417]|uniref:Replication protein A C-terminal domain-containing protein n=1 Tax=Tetrapisispora phaffii (strain ATCC 24235 / CBS 4417 / NBRC 1672 / NRRL Y-8282 / UCD 70-5) TaxID=1071381 RepID=G8C2C3_TETPH|nr:hypothetical protein TPHA_0P01430 [Tetrapisispora phaffii CBS 4417]CCE66301.1 hypothetical protein TPHA_0P01430 [Tetrapisispora phaffii CBS 4417]